MRSLRGFDFRCFDLMNDSIEKKLGEPPRPDVEGRPLDYARPARQMTVQGVSALLFRWVALMLLGLATVVFGAMTVTTVVAHNPLVSVRRTQDDSRQRAYAAAIYGVVAALCARGARKQYRKMHDLVAPKEGTKGADGDSGGGPTSPP